MTLGDIGIVFGITTSMMTAGGAAGDYYLQHEYVPISAFVERDIRETIRTIRELEYDKQNGMLTPKQEWQLEQFKQDLQELERELQK